MLGGEHREKKSYPVIIQRLIPCSIYEREKAVLHDIIYSIHYEEHMRI